MKINITGGATRALYQAQAPAIIVSIMSNTSLPPVLPNDDNISLNVLILVTVACGQSTCQFVSWPLYRLTAVQFSRSFFQSFYSSFFALVSAGGWRLRTNCSRDVCPVLSLRSEVYLNHPRHSSSVCVFIFARVCGSFPFILNLVGTQAFLAVWCLSLLVASSGVTIVTFPANLTIQVHCLT